MKKMKKFIQKKSKSKLKIIEYVKKLFDRGIKLTGRKFIKCQLNGSFFVDSKILLASMQLLF